jgi:hypothetical protein
VTLNPPNTTVNWVHNYQYREDDRKVFRGSIVDAYPDDDAIPLTEFIAYLRTIWLAIPTEWQQNAWIKLGRDDSECGTAADFDVYLERLETDEEFAVRKAKEAEDESKATKAQEARERGMLQALKRKYGE